MFSKSGRGSEKEKKVAGILSDQRAISCALKAKGLHSEGEGKGCGAGNFQH